MLSQDDNVPKPLPEHYEMSEEFSVPKVGEEAEKIYFGTVPSDVSDEFFVTNDCSMHPEVSRPTLGIAKRQ